MNRLLVGRVLSLGLVVVLVVFALSACGGGGDQGGDQEGQDSAKSKGENPLVGTWRRERK